MNDYGGGPRLVANALIFGMLMAAVFVLGVESQRPVLEAQDRVIVGWKATVALERAQVRAYRAQNVALQAQVAVMKADLVRYEARGR